MMPLRSDSTMNAAPDNNSTPRRAQRGDVVTIDFNLTPENGYVPHPLFDTCGKVSFCLGWGGYLPGLHALIEDMELGQEYLNKSIDAGWGSRNPELVVKIAKNKLKNAVEGTKLHIRGMTLEVMQVTEDHVVVDANPPLAGASYSCDVKLLAVSSLSSYKVATFALGCFWGAELAFMRVPGVVGTKVGYTQGFSRHPTYEEVCEGTTKHREAVYVAYDPEVVSYEMLVRVALDRLASTAVSLSTLFHDEPIQYKHGFYYHSQEDRIIAEKMLGDNRYRVELLAASEFYDAEEYHQQYLLKGGQSAEKGSRETIRCFG
jgi:peptide-methionine (S)-S-oxide reductase